MHAFYKAANLASVSLPESLTSIGNYAFYGCTGQ
ncbi:MAG: leucine-rich repeat protein [Alistipes sp.]|nr:leucine-rich repeat protein [Alistipes sp.]